MKRILLVADVKGWIFERHCMEIQKRLTEYHIDIAYCRDNIARLSVDYDMVYVLDPMPLHYPPAHKTIMGLRCEWLYKIHPHGAKGLYESGLSGRCSSIKDKCCIFHVVNRNQLEVFKPIVTDKPLLIAQHGIDEGVFFCKNSSCRSHIKMVGAVGRHGSDGKKGFDIVKKAAEKIGADYQHTGYKGKRLTKHEMPNFYRGLDVFVSLSESEGLCNPLMEAGGIGLPVITTKVGASEEIIQHGYNGLFVDRNIDSVVDALTILDNPEKRMTMGYYLSQTIQNRWTWKVRIDDFRKMFGLFFEMRD